MTRTHDPMRAVIVRSVHLSWSLPLLRGMVPSRGVCVFVFACVQKQGRSEIPRLKFKSWSRLGKRDV